MKLSVPQAKMVVTSASTFWNAKDAVENQVALSEFGQLKAQQGDKVEVGAVTYNENFGAKLKRGAAGLMKVLPTVALGTGAVTATVASAGLLTLPAALGLAGAVGAVTAGLSLSWLSLQLRDMLQKSDAPTGLGLQHSGFERLDFPRLTKSSSPSEALQEMVLANMRHYPSSLQVLHLNGHGHGDKAVAGLPVKEQKQALHQATLESQRKFDVAFYETCYGANFEFLHGQHDSVNYAVAFQDTIPKSNSQLGRLPISEVLSQAVDAENGREAAVRMAQVSGRHFDSGETVPISSVPFAERPSQANRRELWINTDSTAVAVDVAVLRQELSPALDRLGPKLSTFLQEPGAPKLLEKARQKNLLEPTGDLVDLGGFLQTVAEGLAPDAPARVLIEDAQKALSKSILHKRTGQDIPLSGLSFHSRPQEVRFSGPASSAHGDSSLPKGWIDFVADAF